jgi:hypothetical protein
MMGNLDRAVSKLLRELCAWRYYSGNFPASVEQAMNEVFQILAPANQSARTGSENPHG